MDDIKDSVTVKLGGKEFEVLPLSFKAVRQLKPQLTQLANMDSVPTDEQITAITDIVHRALSRNYPDITRDEIEDLIDLGNVRHVIPAIMGVSGLIKGEAGAGSL